MRILKKISLVITVWLLVFSQMPFTTNAAESKKIDEELAFDQENGGFIPGPGAAAEFISENDQGYLRASGSGSGNRTITKTFDEPINDSEIVFSFDWKPNTVLTDLNSSEIGFIDPKGNTIFRLIKEGGTDGNLRYGIGTTGLDVEKEPLIDHVSKEEEWLHVELVLDFKDESVSLEVTDSNNNQFVAENIDVSDVRYINQISDIQIQGNRAGGNNLEFEVGLKNFKINTSGIQAPKQTVDQIVQVVSEQPIVLELPVGVEQAEISSFLPTTVDVELTDGSIVSVGVAWDSTEYDSSEVGKYEWIGTLDFSHFANVDNQNEMTAIAEIQVVGAGDLPEKEGYVTAYYSDFGDELPLDSENWGFTTANATLSVDTDEIKGNLSNKLHFLTEDQSGGRVATKRFLAPVKGTELLTSFEWYPGKLNDKGGNPAENGGELRLTDHSSNLIFAMHYTKNAPLAFIVGKEKVETEFTNPETWYAVETKMDLTSENMMIEITDLETNVSETYEQSLTDIPFDGSIAQMSLAGLRTSGNNITWSTYVDNIGLFYKAIEDESIVRVNQLPYHRLYVNEASDELSTIGLPEEVEVTLANNETEMVEVKEWTVVGKDWNTNEAGVYEFTGQLAETEGMFNPFNRTAQIYVYNRLTPTNIARETEWLDRGVIALKSEEGIFVSWRLLADEYAQDIRFNIYRNEQKINEEPLSITNFSDREGKPNDRYMIETLKDGQAVSEAETVAASTGYLSIPMQKPEGGTTASGDYTYSVNDASVGDLDGDGEYEIIVKWYPSNAIDSSQSAMTGPTIFDAYKLDGTLLWRIDMGLNLTSGAHYHQFLVADFDGDGKSEFLIKTADGTTSYGATDGKFDPTKQVSVIGNPEDNGKWVNENGHVYGGPEYVSVFNGETGEVIDTIDYVFELGDVASWGDTWHNRSDRFLAAYAYLDGVGPSAILGRGYYARTTFVAYDLVDGKLQERWTFDSDVEGRGGGLGYHSLAVGDVDNDGFDEIIAGSLTLDHDGSILYAMDGEMGRIKGSHGDALHVGAFDPDREGLHVFGVHEETEVASVEYHDGATGETLQAYYAYKDAGRGLAANITSKPGYEFWGTAGGTVEEGGGIYSVQGDVIADSFRDAGLSINFALYWDGDLLHELLDDTQITKYDEQQNKSILLKDFEGVVSNNGTKATPTLQADILGDWREEVLLPTTDSSELRIYSTTIPTEYRIYTLMHDPVYRTSIGWQNSGYNQPPHIGFYLGEDIKEDVLAGKLPVPNTKYTKGTEEPETPVDPEPQPEQPENPGNPSDPNPDPEDPNKPNPEPDQPEEPNTGQEEANQPGNSNAEKPSNPNDGQELPNTATNMMNDMVMGGSLILLAAFIFIIRNRRKLREK